MFCFLKQDEGQRVAIQQNNMPDTTPEEKKRGGEDRRKQSNRKRLGEPDSGNGKHSS